MKARPSPAMVVALISLFVALSGVAAAGLKKNTVKSKQIKDGQVASVDVRDDDLTGQDINEGSLNGLRATPSGGAGGDLTGSYPNPSIAGSAIGSAEVANNSLGAADVNESGLDSSVLQRRISTACPGGQAIESVGATGTPSCTTLGGPPSGPAGGDLAGGTDYPNPTIANDAVNAAKIQNGQVGDPEIATDAVRTAEILDGSVTGADVDEASLGTVPTATDANTLDGLDSSVFERKTRIAFGHAGGNGTTDQVILSGGTGIFTFDILNDGDVDESTEVRIRATDAGGLHVSSPTTTTTVAGNTTSAQIDASPSLLINNANNTSLGMLLDCRVDRASTSDSVLCFGTRSSAP